MELKQWITEKRGRQSLLAKEIGAHPPDVSRWIKDPGDENYRPIPHHFGPKIEKATNGEVTRKEMFSDWEAYWPELANAA